MGNGCFKMDMICLEGSECTITPNKCMNLDNQNDESSSSSFDHMVNGIDCPILKQSQSEKEDEVLLKNEKNKQKYQQSLFKLQQHNEENEINIYQNRNNAEFVAMVM